MKEILRALYSLQRIDSQLDELHELRGDLPDAVNVLSDKQRDLKARVEMIDAFTKHGAIDRDRKEKECLALMEKIEVYKSQQLQVRTNKEYDALTKEIDTANETIRIYEEEIEHFAEEVGSKKEQREELQAQLDIVEEELREKRQELEDILRNTEEEEADLSMKRERVLRLISEDDMTSYLRIREAKKGRAVVPVKKGACSGCYNVVPPQMILQIKKDDRLYMCEHCGRIVVSEELAKDTSLLQ